MSKYTTSRYVRAFAATLEARLREPRRFLQVVAGPRQVGKTTLVLQVLGAVGTPSAYVSADEPTLRDRAWIAQRWEEARSEARRAGDGGSILALDEIQKVPGWSETVKRLWDEDTAPGSRCGSCSSARRRCSCSRGSPRAWRGASRSLRLPHWSFAEMRTAFGFSLEQYLHFGGYPGAAPLVDDPERWARYILDSLIETTISRDVLLLTRVDKPALLRRLFELGCRYSGQVLSYTKMLGQLQDAGNTTTLAHYLDLLAGAGMLTGLPKYRGRRSSGSGVPAPSCRC